MSDEREPLAEGSYISVNGRAYRIFRVLGAGSNAVCYTAEYTEGQGGAGRQTFLIKELYPLLKSGKLTRRTSDGSLILSPGAEREFEWHRKSFMRSVEINKLILNDSPLKASANIDVFGYGDTLYNVMFDFHGKTMANEKFKDIGEASERMLNILSSLRPFHKNGVLHLDISPDNIFVHEKDENKRELMRPVVLIDYNGAQYLDDIRAGEFDSISLKPPYTAPEAHNYADRLEVSFCTDLWSVCVVFLRCITGDTPGFPKSYAEVRSFLRRLGDREGLLWDAPKTAVSMVFSILQKGLSQTAEDRYQSIDEMEADFKELHDRYYLLGITKSTVWEASAAYFDRFSREYASRKVSVLDESAFSGRVDLGDITQKRLLLLYGSAGIGKTTELINIWRSHVSSYEETSPIAVYIPLREYSCQDFIRERCIGRTNLNVFDVVSGQHKRDNTAARFNSILNTGGEDHVAVILLLDGLNELPTGLRSTAMGEINRFIRDERVTVVITDRTETTHGTLGGFTRVPLPPLDAAKVCTYLDRLDLARPASANDLELLRNPMMLSFYVNIGIKKSETVSGLDSESLFEKYIKLLTGGVKNEYRNAAGFAVNVVAPVIAGEMAAGGANVISVSALNKLVREVYDSVNSKEFPSVFGEYCEPDMDSVAGGPNAVKTASAWFYFIVGDILMRELSLITKTETGSYAFPHQCFDDSFALACEKVTVRLAEVKKSRDGQWQSAATARSMTAQGLAQTAVYMETAGDNGVIYKGIFNDLLTGRGVMVFPNKDWMYVGELDEGVMWGDGTLVSLHNGGFWHVAIADWENGRKSRGLFKWGTGEVYLGTFDYEGRQCGRGVKVYPQGKIESGFWDGDRLVISQEFDDVKFIVKEGSALPLPVRMRRFSGFLGNTQNDIRIGKGAVLYPDRQSLFYGRWGRSGVHGHGCFVNSNDYVHWGSYEGGHPNGFGIRAYFDGSIDIGEWVKDNLAFDYKGPQEL